MEAERPSDYLTCMMKNDFRDRVLAAMKERGVNKAELSRQSGVSYHALDKWLKGVNASTSEDRATAIAQALGITVESSGTYEELRALYYQLSPERRAAVLDQLRGLLALQKSEDRE